MKKIIMVLIALLLIPSMASAQVTKEQYYARSTLEGNELEFYDAAYDAIANQGDVYAQDYGVGEDRAQQIINYVYNDSPELFNGYGIYTQDEIYDLNERLKNEADKILSDIPEDTTDYEKVKAVYFYLGKTIKYDFDAVATETFDEDQTVIGGILSKKAVCGGISSSLQYLLYQLDVPCYKVCSDTISGDIHTSNIINIDGEWYYCDLTYDMDSIKNGTLKYFLKDDIFTKTHTINEDLNPQLPACTSDKYMREPEEEVTAPEEKVAVNVLERTMEPEEQKEPLVLRIFNGIAAALVTFFTNIFS